MSISETAGAEGRRHLGDISGAAMDRPVVLPRWRRWVTKGAPLIVLVVLVAVAFASWPLLRDEDSYRVAASDVDLHAVGMREFEDAIPLRGQVMPKVSTFVEAALAGTVEVVLVEDGARVEAGQPLMRLRNASLELLTAEREAAIMQMLADVLNAQTQLERDHQAAEKSLAEAAFRAQTARSEFEKQEMLFQSGFVSDLMLRRHEADSRFASEQHEALLATQARSQELASRQAVQLADLGRRIQRALSNARQALDGLIIRSPASGVLSGLVPKPGQRLDVGARVAQIDSAAGVKIVGTIDEFYLSRVTPGQTAEGVTDKGAELVITKVLPQVVSGRITIELDFRGQEPMTLRRGQTYESRLRLAAPTRTLVVPNAAFLADSGGAYVYKLEPAGNVARKVAVRLGRKNTKWIEVLEGLAPGDQIVVSSYSPFKAHEWLRITKS